MPRRNLLRTIGNEIRTRDLVLSGHKTLVDVRSLIREFRAQILAVHLFTHYVRFLTSSHHLNIREFPNYGKLIVFLSGPVGIVTHSSPLWSLYIQTTTTF